MSYFSAGPQSHRAPTGGDVLLCAEAMLTLVCTRVAILILPSRRLMTLLGSQVDPTGLADGGGPYDVAVRVARIVEAVSRRLPLRRRCLTQAIAAKLMLQRRGVSSTLRLGLGRIPDATDSSGTDPFKGIVAHAWLSVGGSIILGGDEGDYRIVASFT